jgi:hypothetical protein
LPINNPSAPGYAIRPRARVLCGGQEIPNVAGVSVTSTGNFHADSFSFVSVPVDGGIGSLAWWANLPPITPQNPIDVQVGLLPLGAQEGQGIAWTSLVQGRLDDAAYAIESNTLTVSGRDFSSLMIDDRTQNAFQNQTTSEVVQTLATKFGLQCSAIQTTTPVGRFWSNDHVFTNQNQLHSVTTSWDILKTLAQFEGLDVYMDGITLTLAKPADANSDPYVITWSKDTGGRQLGNAPGLQMKRSLALNRGIRVVVRSWNAKQKKTFSRGALSSKTLLASATQDVQQYFFTRPGLTEEQAQQLANQLYADIVAKEMSISATMIGDLILTPRCVISLQGTGTDWDQSYYPNTVTKRIDMAGGFSMMFDARNKSNATEAATIQSSGV